MEGSDQRSRIGRKVQRSPEVISHVIPGHTALPRGTINRGLELVCREGIVITVTRRWIDLFWCLPRGSSIGRYRTDNLCFGYGISVSNDPLFLLCPTEVDGIVYAVGKVR